MDRTGPADGDISLTEKASMAVRLATIGAGAVLAVAAAVWLLVRAAYFWQNPLEGAWFRLVTDFEGTEQAGAISRDGKFIAFLADQDGPVDDWVTQVGTSQFHNLTRSTICELTNPSVRTISFSPDSAQVSFWVREPVFRGWLRLLRGYGNRVGSWLQQIDGLRRKICRRAANP